MLLLLLMYCVAVLPSCLEGARKGHFFHGFVYLSEEPRLAPIGIPYNTSLAFEPLKLLESLCQVYFTDLATEATRLNANTSVDPPA